MQNKGQAVLTPKQASSMTPCHLEPRFSDVGSFESRAISAKRKRLHYEASFIDHSQMEYLYDDDKYKTNVVDHIGLLGNNQSSNTMVCSPTLGESLAFSEANSQSSQHFLQMFPKVCNNLLPGLDAGITSSTTVPYIQFYIPSDGEAKCPFTRQNQSCFPGESWTLAISYKILLTYVQYKKSVTIIGDPQVSFINYMHSKACKNHTCKCEQYFSLVSHYDGCHGADCKICSPVWYTIVTNKLDPAFEPVKRYLLGDSTDGDSVQPIYGSSVTMQPSLKCLKVENPCLNLPEIGICHATAPSEVQPGYPKLPPLQQLPESPVSINAVVMDAHMGVLPKLIEDSTSTKEIGVNDVDNFPLLATETGPSEGVVGSYKLVETHTFGSYKEADVDFWNGNSTADYVIHHSDNVRFNTLPGFSEGLAAGCEEGEREVRTTSERAELVIENELIAQESNCRMELNAGCKDGETEARTNANQARLTNENEVIAQELNFGKEKMESQNIRGVSLIENFTAQQIMEHILSLRQCIDQDMPKKDRGNTIVNIDSENSCQLCGADKLLLASTPIYCSLCSTRIRRSAIYYNTSEGNDIRHCFCTTCYKASRGESIMFSGFIVSKEKLNKMKNDEEFEELWVQCDKCEGWQHQICALYNAKNDMEGKAQFICPKCCLKQIQNGERIPPLTSTGFGAKDLPRTMLSDHIEQRLFTRLQKEREEKARVTGKSINEVPEAEGLVVRVVLSVDKLVKVKNQLLDTLKNENYPSEFPYKSKVILLFQKIEGVDVCLFSMYAQEFGSECGQPNQRCIYISYLDSVKYFRLDTETASGEALRTIVYHEILIGYLEYCKKQGFGTCYLWACPPLKGEDYILYCHPEIQKTPKSDKLRHWYLSMLRKAAKEKVVVDLTNLYDQFFVSTGQYNFKVTAARLPYFDGDYWSGAAEDVLKNIEKASSEDPRKMGKKTVSKRTLKAMGHTNPSGDATKDILLMQQLGQNILPIKENFIIAHLQFVCTYCHKAILSGCRWFCSLCKGFQLCERCHGEQRVYKESTHTSCNGEKHSLSKITVDDVPSDTNDNDVSMNCCLFENRHGFLSLCQRNKYQFDTLRRAKYSSMMILHYLHNPSLMSAETTCSICYKDTPMDQRWLCDICPNVAVCAACFGREGCSVHDHKLTLHSSMVTSATKDREMHRKELLITQLLDVLLHACQCDSSCSYPDCVLMKKLFSHAKNCTVRASGGCQNCKKTWLILRLHSRNCKESDCDVPRCRDIKQHVKISAQQSETLGKGGT